MTSDGDSSAETCDGVSSPTEELGGQEKHSKRAGELDPGLDPRPYESSSPSQQAVQRTGSEERALRGVGEGPVGDGVDGSEAADDEPTDDQMDVELVNQPDQPNMGPPQTAPAPEAPRREHD
jgi:hypothetical protein